MWHKQQWITTAYFYTSYIPGFQPGFQEIKNKSVLSEKHNEKTHKKS